MGEIVAAMLPPRAASPKKEPESKFKSAESGYRPSGPDAEDQACCEDGPGTLLAVVISPPANSVAVSDVGAGRPEASKAAASHSVLQRTLLVAQLGCLAFTAAVLLPTGLGGSKLMMLLIWFAAMQRWGLPYCVGAAPVVKALEAATDEFNLEYKSEDVDGRCKAGDQGGRADNPLAPPEKRQVWRVSE